MKPFFIGAAVLCFFGGLCFLLEIQSPSFVQWHGIEVHGDTYRGVTTYWYDGVPYSIDNPDVSAGDLHHLPTTVWLPYSDPDNPERAFIESPWDRWTDFALVTGWFFAAVGLVMAGMIRLWFRRRRAAERTSAFGVGLDPELVQRLLDEGRRRPPHSNE
jgi:hypothetical protein